MKKLRSFFFLIILSTCLVGNVFAGETAGSGVYSFFENAVNTFATLLNLADPCEGRICTTCKPGSVRGDGGTCRPTDN
jgi:hypothetical protein